MDEKQIANLSKSMGDAELIETHISWIFLKDDSAYKIKKPVKFSFLDFSTFEKRRYYCEEELRLNTRLAPDVYLEVVHIVEKDGIVELEGDGKIIDHAVKMKRLPQERRMDVLLKQGEVTEDHVKRIAEIVAQFHERIDVIEDEKFSSADVVKEQIDDLGNHKDVIERACGLGSKVDFILEKCDEFIEKNKALFEERQEQGKIRDCHGDLHSANIFLLDSEVIIFDCIEFSRDFRFVDVASEIAFMAMDLDAFGREDFAELFVEEYLNKTQDSGLKTVIDLYKCYRANVRAKIAAIDYSQHPNEEAKGRIRKYITLAERYARPL